MKERARVQKQKQNQNHAHAGSALSSNRISTSSAGHVDTFSDHNPNGMDTSAAYGLDVDLSKVCRCCLVESDTLKTLFCNQIVNGSIVAFPAVIESVTGSKVRPDDGHPEKLCASCRHSFVEAYTLQQKFKANRRLIGDIIDVQSTGVDCKPAPGDLFVSDPLFASQLSNTTDEKRGLRIAAVKANCRNVGEHGRSNRSQQHNAAVDDDDENDVEISMLEYQDIDDDDHDADHTNTFGNDLLVEASTPRPPAVAVVVTGNRLPALPIRNHQELEQFERNLMDEEYSKKTVKYLKQLDSKFGNCYQRICVIMDDLLSVQLAETMCWSGSANKKPFKQFARVKRLLHEILNYKTVHQHQTVYDTHQAIQGYFKRHKARSSRRVNQSSRLLSTTECDNASGNGDDGDQQQQDDGELGEPSNRRQAIDETASANNVRLPLRSRSDLADLERRLLEDGTGTFTRRVMKSLKEVDLPKESIKARVRCIMFKLLSAEMRAAHCWQGTETRTPFKIYNQVHRLIWSTLSYNSDTKIALDKTIGALSVSFKRAKQEMLQREFQRPKDEPADDNDDDDDDDDVDEDNSQQDALVRSPPCPYPDMPFREHSDVVEFDRKLAADQEFLKSMIKYLKPFDTYHKSFNIRLTHVLDKILSIHLVGQYCWRGRASPKERFADRSHVVHLLWRTLNYNCDVKCSLLELNNGGKNYFKRFKQRLSSSAYKNAAD